MQFLHRIFSSTPSAVEELPSSAIRGLANAQMILTNAAGYNDADDIKASIGRAMQELEPVLQLAKEASAELQGSFDPIQAEEAPTTGEDSRRPGR